MTTGERLKFLRNSKKLTLDEVAAAAGTIKQTIYKYEHNIVTNIPKERIEVLASILETTPAYLLCLVDDPDPNINYNKLIRDLMKIDIQRANDREGMRLLSIPDVDLDIAVQLADAELLDTVHRICGMNDQEISDVAAAGRIRKVWNSEKINIVRGFVEDNEKTLRKMMESLEK